jgi:hypothetical protein
MVLLTMALALGGIARATGVAAARRMESRG